MQVRRVTEVEKLRELLMQQPFLNAYMLCDLDPPFSQYAKWMGCFDSTDRVTAVLLLYSGLSVPVVLACGSHDEVALLYKQTHSWFLPQRVYSQVHERHGSTLGKYYRMAGLERILRMSLSKDRYQRPEAFDQASRLGHQDTAQIMQLYSTHYPNAFFEPYQLETGYYFGIKDGDQLVSIAGIHGISEKSSIAAIGNVVTHPDYRSKRLSTRCIARLLDELFTVVDKIALNVREDNVVAQRTFSNLGFEPRATFLEGIIRRL